MAFNEKEQEIINWGLKNGKTKEEVTTAVNRYRTGTPTSTVAPNENKAPGQTDNFISKTINSISTGEPAYKASVGGAETILPNIGKTALNVPSSTGRLARAVVAPVNPLDTNSPINIGKNIVESAVALSDISKQGFVEGTKNILGGFADTYLKLGESIYGSLDKAYNALLDNPQKAVSDAGTALAKIGVEDPALIPSFFIGAGEVKGTDVISKVASPITRGADTSISGITNKIVDTASEVVEGTAEKLFRTADVTIKTSKQGVESLLAKPIPEAYKTTLKETPTAKFDEYASVAQKATESFKNPTPLEIAGTKAQGALDTIDRKLQTIGGEKSGVMAQSSVGNKTVGNIAVKFRRDLANVIKNKSTVAGDSKLVDDVITKAEALGSNPTATQVDGFIDYVQDRIYTGGRDLTLPTTDATTATLRRLTGELNESLKAQLPDSYRTLNNKYAKMIETRNELNNKLGNDGEKGGVLMKRVFSPSDANTKKLFADVKEITGVDLVDEATVARFVMEAVGDSRQASILQQLQLPPLSQRGIIDFVLEKITSSINTPKVQLKRARSLTK